MDGPEPHLGTWGLLLSLGLGVGCAASPPPARTREAAPTLPPQTMSSSGTAAATPEPTPTPVPTPTPDPTVVVVEAGGTTEEGSGLVAAARAERERRRAAGRPTVVLDDKNIRDFAKDKKLTFANPEPNPASGGTRSSDAARGVNPTSTATPGARPDPLLWPRRSNAQTMPSTAGTAPSR